MNRVWFSILVVTAAYPVAAEPPHPVVARLVADTAGVARVGVHLAMEPGWHVYWVNPGDAGLATEVLWSPPEGVALGPLQWPAPEAFISPGELTSFGYADEVTLAATLGALPGELRGRLRADVAWLACKEVCVLGDAALEVELEKLDEIRARDAFRALDGRAVRAPGDAPFVTRHDRGVDGSRVWLTWADEPTSVEVFPAARSGRHPSATTRTRGGLTRIDLNLEGVMLPVDLIVVAVDGANRTGYRVPVGTE